MRTFLRLTFVASAIAMPLVAGAQPGAPTPPVADPGTGPGSGSDAAGAGSGTTTGADDAKIRELVDHELARILADRATKEAAERAAKENEQPASPANQPGDMTGSSGFFDTRVAFTLTDENMLVKPGETIPSVPGLRFGVPNSLGTLFFDNYDTRYSGFETLSHAVMYRNFHRGHFDAEAAIVLRLNELTANTINVTDDGSYLTLSNWKDPTHHDPERISLTVFPVSSDRFRLGYSYRLSWGGDTEYQRAVKSAVPGMKVQYDAKNYYVFAGAKSAVVLDLRTAEDKAALAALAGAGVDASEMVRVEVNGGYFDRGYNELQDVNDQKVQLFGASAQVSLHHGMPVQSSIDYKLYKNNGEQIGKLFSPVVYPGGTSWLLMAEATMIGQTLKDPDKTGVTKIQDGHAADANFRMMIDRVRLRADISYRDLAFILHTQPSLPTYEDFPTAYQTSPDLFADVGVDRNWNDFLTLGVIAGIEKPATLTSPSGIPGGGTGVSGTSTAVIRNNNINTIITILPVGQSAVPQVAIKGTARLDFGKIYAALFELYYSYDGNQTEYERVGCGAAACPDSPFQYVFGQFNQLGFNATLQARF